MDQPPQVSESFLLAFLPVVGIAVIAIHQIGRFEYFGVPLEFLEVDTVKVILSGLALGLYVAASIYALSILFDGESSLVGWRRIFIHLGIAIFFTFPFWIKGLSFQREISWATVGFVAFAAFVTTWAERYLKTRGDSDSAPLLSLRRAGPFLGTVFWMSLLILAATFAHGYITAKEQPRIFIEGTHQLVVARSGDLLVTKKYDFARESFDRSRTVLVRIEDGTVLVERSAID